MRKSEKDTIILLGIENDMKMIGYTLLILGFAWILAICGAANFMSDASYLQGIDKLPKGETVKYDEACQAIGRASMVVRNIRMVVLPGLMMLIGGLILARTSPRTGREEIGDPNIERVRTSP